MNKGIRLEVSISECHVPGTGFFLKKSGKFPVPSIREQPFPGSDSVRSFGTGCFPVSFWVGKHSGIPEHFPNENQKSLKIWYYSRLFQTVLSSPISSRLFPSYPKFSRVTRPENISLIPVQPIRKMSSSLVSSRLVSFKTSSGMQTSTLDGRKKINPLGITT